MPLDLAIDGPRLARSRLIAVTAGMPRELKISVGQHSDKGRKETNQDFHGVLIPDEPLLSLKGIAVVLADGISSSERQPGRQRVGGQGLPDRLLLHLGILVGEDLGAARARRDQLLAACADARSQYAYDKDRGYVCTLSAMVIKSTTAHIFHVGDSRIYRVSGNALEQLTDDHRVVVSSQQSYLGRALGVNPQIEIDYQSLQVEKGDIFVLATDGVYEHRRRRASSPRRSATAPAISTRPRKAIVERGLRARQRRQPHRPDRPDRRAAGRRGERSVRRSRANCRCRRCSRRAWCSTATASCASCTAAAAATSISPSTSRPTTLVVLKIPSIDLRDDPAYLKRFMMEEWVARRIDSAACAEARACSRASATTSMSSPNSSTARR